MFKTNGHRPYNSIFLIKNLSSKWFYVLYEQGNKNLQSIFLMTFLDSILFHNYLRVFHLEEEEYLHNQERKVQIQGPFYYQFQMLKCTPKCLLQLKTIFSSSFVILERFLQKINPITKC